MRIRILGSAAGGGFPQWNCNCSNCYGVRNGKIKATPRTQSSIAVSSDDEHWLLINASPDIRAQLESFRDIQPQRGLRGTGIRSVLLVDSQIDHTTGLLMLREGCPFDVYTTEMVYQDLSTGFPIFNILQSWDGGIRHQRLPIDGTSLQIPGFDALRITPVPLQGKAPPYSPHRHNPHPGDNIALYIEDLQSGQSLFYAPGLGGLDDNLAGYMAQSDCLLVDGTFWREDEMILAGVGTKLAREMGHLPQSGKGGMIEVLRRFDEPRKVLIHINNTNPILDEESPERAELVAEGIEVACDGMDIFLGASKPQNLAHNRSQQLSGKGPTLPGRKEALG